MEATRSLTLYVLVGAVITEATDLFVATNVVLKNFGGYAFHHPLQSTLRRDSSMIPFRLEKDEKNRNPKDWREFFEWFDSTVSGIAGKMDDCTLLFPLLKFFETRTNSTGAESL